MSGVIKVNPLPGTDSLHDCQVFEYTDTLSLPVDETVYSNSGIGDVVKVGDTYGVLVTKIMPKNGKIVPGDRIYNTPTYGMNGPGYASVRVSGGAFWLNVEHSGEIKAGMKVYAKNAVAGGKTAVTTDKANATEIGFLIDTIPAAAQSPARARVALKH